MKENKANIFYAWLVMFCFIAGQYTVYSHQHKIISSCASKTHRHANHQTGPIVQEKCSACDAMHHLNAVISPDTYISLNIVTKHFQPVYNYTFVSIALILSAGRGPPALVYC
ncbi:hypothetical protein [Mucilaginibacter antarcticus]|uniref:DUF2946 domain-containing protein n=1 Tax=Mucilaginibacter antarcticus TaxID=1855725 RepID=A0ABW5XJ78_9SPHI